MIRLLIAFLTILYLSSCAAPDRLIGGSEVYWEPIPGPEVAVISAIGEVDNESPLLAGSGAGLYSSEDRGETWQLRSSVNWRVLSVLRTTAGTILVGTYRHGIHRSVDGGLTWTTVGFEANVYVDSIIEDQQRRIFAAVAHSVNGEPCGIFRSDDDGRTWTPAGLRDRHAYSIRAPLTEQLFAGTEDGTFRSLDGGETWLPIEALSFAAPLSDILHMDGTLFACFAEPRHRAPGAGMLLSRDEGATWTRMEGLPPETSVHELAMVGNSIFAATGDLTGRGGRGVYVCRDEGTCERRGLDNEWVVSLKASRDGTLYAGTAGSGIKLSFDNGSTWISRSSGIRDWSDAALAFDRSGRLLALTPRALYIYDDADELWLTRDLPDGTALPTPWNFICWLDGQLVLPGRGGVFLWHEAGRSWRWSEVPGASSNVLAVHASKDGRLFVVFTGEGVFMLERPGAPWVRVDAPDDTASVFVSPAGTLFAIGTDSLHRSSDSGGWTRVGPTGRRSFSMQALGDVLCLASPPDGILASRDDGRTWEPVSRELLNTTAQPGYLGAHSLLVLPGGNLLCATFSDGVLIWNPERGWTNVTAGLASGSTGDVALGPDGRAYIHTSAGIYRATF